MCSVPPGEQANVNVCPSFPLSDVAFISQVVGVPELVEAGGAGEEAGPALELSAEVFVCPPPPAFGLLFSFLRFEQPALQSTIAAIKKTPTQIIARSNPAS
jgi:hypothetical protein